VVSMYVCDHKGHFLMVLEEMGDSFHTPFVFHGKMNDSMSMTRIAWKSYDEHKECGCTCSKRRRIYWACPESFEKGI